MVVVEVAIQRAARQAGGLQNIWIYGYGDRHHQLPCNGLDFSPALYRPFQRIRSSKGLL